LPQIVNCERREIKGRTVKKPGCDNLEKKFSLWLKNLAKDSAIN
jgi:hypothetical protein